MIVRELLCCQAEAGRKEKARDIEDEGDEEEACVFFLDHRSDDGAQRPGRPVVVEQAHHRAVHESDYPAALGWPQRAQQQRHRRREDEQRRHRHHHQHVPDYVNRSIVFVYLQPRSVDQRQHSHGGQK